MYKVVKSFTDLLDDNHVYLAGGEFPRKGANPSAERIDELSSKFNKRGEILIEAVVEENAEQNGNDDEAPIPEADEQKVEEPKSKPKRKKKE